MADRALLVPMSVEALLVPDGSAKAVSLAPRFENFDECKLGAMLRPEPWQFDDLAIDLEEGVHLHWRLPAALTHGLQTTDGAAGRRSAATSGAATTEATPAGRIEFPRVPNRWLVLRVAATQAQTRAWVVRSDDLAEESGTNMVLTLTEPPPAGAGEATRPKYVVKKIGRAYRYDEPWERDSAPREVELTAVSAGNPIFAAFYPGCRNVFGFHDDLAGVDAGAFLYFVAGWYSRHEDDPLSPDYPRASQARHVKEQWGLERFSPKPAATASGKPAATPSAKPGPMPTRTVCHGTLYGVRWKRKGTSVPVGAPEYRVAVGNTAVEALSALVAAPAQRGRLWEPLLSAFQYGALGDRDPTRGMPEIDAELHRRRFQPVDGGTQWMIQRVESSAATAGERPRPSFPADEDVAALYNALDDAQREHDRLAREVVSLREEAYAAWFRGESGRAPNGLNELIDALVGQIVTTVLELADAREKVGHLCGELQEKGIRVPSGAGDGAPPRPEYELIAAPMSWFWRASDPAVLVATLGASRTHRYEATRPAACRVVEEVVKALDVSVNVLDASLRDRRVTVALEARKLPVPAKAGGAMPFDEITALFHESLFFDPSRAADIAVSAYGEIAAREVAGSSRVTALVEKIRAALGGDPRHADDIRPIGVRPDGAMTSWEPTWDPLFMFWEVAWAPTYTGPATPELIRQWTLGDDGEYRWTGDPRDEARRYLGWAPLSLDLSRQIQERLKAAPEIARVFTTWGMLTQTIGGLHDALIMREHTMQLPPLREDGTVDGAVAELFGAAPPWSPLDVDRRLREGFFPIRAGHMGILRLWLIDGFGRLEKVLDSDARPAAVTAAESLRSLDGPPGPWIALPPRIAQPARLLFRWRSVDRRESNANPTTSPIAGWIIPDHLDKGLLVCDARGRVRGELRLTTAGVSWAAAPGFAERWDPVRSLADVLDLRSFAGGLVKAGGPALKGLLDLIDRVSMSITTGGARQVQGLGVFTGQPLALARASLALEVWGRRATDQRTAATSTGGVGSVRVPVLLGDMRKGADGLVGYFIDDYQRLRAAFAAPAPSPPHRYFADSEVELSLDGGRVDVTLLMDPRAGVHVSSGIFPAQVLDLPGYVLADALDGLQQSFPVGPVLGDPDAFRIPVPDNGGSWAWVDRDRDRAPEWAENRDVAKPDIGPASPARPLRVHEGWLSFKPVDPQAR